MENAVVLVAEDDVDLLDRMVLALAKYSDVSVAVARDGLQVLREARWLNPDLVVLDRDIPGIDGMYLLRQLKMQPATKVIPVIGVTANGRAAAEALEAGCVATMPKPVDVDAFDRLVQEQLGRKMPAVA